MTDSPIQPDSFNEELLSGYLDGELSSDEQAQVERIVQQDPRAQQLLEDMEQLRQCLQELPENQPPVDTRRRVLEQINHADPVDSGQVQQVAAPRTPPVRAIVSWVVAAAAGVALLFIVPPLLQDSTQVAKNSDSLADSSQPEESAESEGLGDDSAATGEMAGVLDSIERYANGEMDDALANFTEAIKLVEEMDPFDESIPVVYVTVPADAVEHIDEILAANSIRSVGPAELNDRLRANGQYRERNPFFVESAIELGTNADAAPGGGLAGRARPLNEQPALTVPAEDQRRQVNQYRQHSILLLEGSPEKMEVAWEQISQYKDSQLVQQAGPQLKGLRYDANAYRDQSLADKNPPADQDLNKAQDGDPSRATSLSQGAGKVASAPAAEQSTKRRELEDAKNGAKEKKSEGFAVTRKSDNAPSQIVIQLIIQVAE
ncbi:MAG: zf-HC2 domain-containing protein [Pirellulaceae bacterium]